MAPTEMAAKGENGTANGQAGASGATTVLHPSIHDIGGVPWFFERDPQAFPGQAFGLQVEEILHHTELEYQDILIFRSTTFGNVLVLNGIVQCTEKDEFAYQELITHSAVMAHESPKRVLVIGGGDCGVVRELVKHVDYGVDAITMVEIDKRVIELLVQYLPHMARFHDHPRANIVIADGFEFLKTLAAQDEHEKYDVIITDSSDPEGPAEDFFQESYFELLRNALRPNGVVIMQSSENIWLNIDYLKTLVGKARSVFANVAYSQCYMPSYTSGQLGLIVATNDAGKTLNEPARRFSREDENRLFRYYSADVHRASFVLPLWAQRTLEPEHEK